MFENVLEGREGEMITLLLDDLDHELEIELLEVKGWRWGEEERESVGWASSWRLDLRRVWVEGIF